MPTIAVVQEKGGVGKSTLASNIAWELHQKTKSVNLIDLDKSQQSLQDCAALAPDGFLSHVLLPAKSDTPTEFKKQIQGLARSTEWLVLDAPPGTPDVGIMAAALSDIIVMPVLPGGFDFLATKRGVETMKTVVGKLRGKKPIIAVVPNRVDTRTVLGKRTTRKVLKTFSGVEHLPAVYSAVVLAEAPAFGKTVGEYAPSSRSVKDIAKVVKAIRRIIE